jgi:hypothetical protein
MNPEELHQEIIIPSLELLHSLGGPPRSVPAERMLVAICGQEAGYSARYQRSKGSRGWFKGPARGLWQFEKGGGVAGVLQHPASYALARAICEERGVRPAPASVHPQLEFDDTLACAFARLLLWTDPRPLPGQAGSWAYYLRNWRPGKPHPSKWPGYYRDAINVVGAAR